MQKGTSIIYMIKDVIDGLIARTIHVRNERFSPPPPRGESGVTTEWVCFLGSEDSLESELIQHLPPVSSLTVSLQSIIYDDASLPPPIITGSRRLSSKDFKRMLTTYNAQKQAYRLELDRVSAILGSPITLLVPQDNHLGGPVDPLGLQPSGGLKPQDLSTSTGQPPLAVPVSGETSPGVAEVLVTYEDSSKIPDEVVEYLLKRDYLNPKPVRDLPQRVMELGDTILEATLVDFTDIPKLPGTPFSVPEMFIQILFGIRAVLLALIDISGSICLDRDFVGSLPASDLYRALDQMSRWELDDFVPNVKYWKDYPLASCLGNEPPKIPSSWTKYGHKEGEPLFGGQLRALWRRLCHPLPTTPDAGQLFRACFTLAQSKKGFHPVPESFVNSAYKKHSIQLSIPQSEGDFTELGLFVRLFFRNFQPKGLLRSLTRQEASVNASNMNGRKFGGAREDIRSELSSLLGTPLDNSLVRMVETTKGVVEERGFLPPSLVDWSRIVDLPINRERAYESLPEKVLAKIPPEHRQKYPFAAVRGITEPLKVRVITAMPALSTFLSKPLQKALWNYLSIFPQFSLIHQTFHTELLHDLLARHRELFGKDSEWDFVSGDYSAATDKIKIQATKLVLNEIIRKLSSEDLPLVKHFREVIHELLLVYPASSGVDPVLQQEGQLMGSVLSFTILCVINLYTYFKSLEEPMRIKVLTGKLSIKKFPVLINGDDILFRANSTMYNRWKVAGASVGFELSVGKNFIHPNFFTINSLPLEYHSGHQVLPPSLPLSSLSDYSWADLEDLPLGTFEPLTREAIDKVVVHGFINIGLLIGLSKTASGTRDDSIPLSGWFSGAVMGAMYPEKATNYFLNYHSKEIRRQTKFGSVTLNIYAHPALGGLGFPVPPGVEPRFSQHQRALASKLLQFARKEFLGQSSDQPLRNFAYLSPSTKAIESLGRRPRFVVTRLVDPSGPLFPWETPFTDDSLVLRTPLSSAYALGGGVLTPMCRLPNSVLGKLLREANHHRMPVLPVSEMTSFPYRLVIVDKEFEELHLARTSGDDIPSPLTINETDAPTISNEQPLPPVEEWETLEFPTPPTSLASVLSPTHSQVDPVETDSKSETSSTRVSTRSALKNARRLAASERRIQNLNLGY